MTDKLKYSDESTEHKVVRVNAHVAENFDNWYLHIKSKYGQDLNHCEVASIAAQLTTASYLEEIQYKGVVNVKPTFGK